MKAILFSADLGGGLCTEEMDYNIYLNEKEEEIYYQALFDGRNLNEVEALQPILNRAYEEILEMVEDGLLDAGDPFVETLMGKITVDPDRLNELVWAKTPFTLDALNMTEDKVEGFDAHKLDAKDLPYICEVDPEFVPRSAFDCGYKLNVRYK